MRCSLFALALLALAGDAQAAADQALLFVSNRDGNAQIYRIGADGSGERALTRGPAENTEPAWSPDGRRIAFTSYRDGNAEIYVMQADGSGQQRLTREPAADNAPAWTADGRIVFRSVRDRWANFYVMADDGGALQQLTADQADKGVPVLSPDSRWLAYVGHRPAGGSDILVMPSAGGPARNLTAALSGNPRSHPAWSPDGRRIAYVESRGLALNVMVIDRDGANPGRITDNAYTNAFPNWSPDGRRIAFVSSREGTRTEMARGDIWVMDADGTHATNLSRHPDEDNYPAWAADGESIFFVSLRDGNAQIYSVSTGGAEARRLTHNGGHDVMIRPRALPATASAAKARVPVAEQPAVSAN